MKRCLQCKGERLSEATTEERLEVAGKTFEASVPVIRCADCGESYYPGPELERFELEVAGALAEHGEMSAEAFRFMRKALGVRACELAELLDVAQETVSRWEHGRLPIERRAAALLSAMVLDRLEGRTATLDRLKALLKPEPLPSLVRVVPRSA